MKLSEVNEWLAFGANVGVLVGIVFLIFEIQQSNRIAIASIETEIRNNFSANNESIYGDSEMVEILLKAQEIDSLFSGSEQIKVDFWIRRLMNGWLALETSYDNGMATEETYNLLTEDILSVVTYYPSLHPTLRRIVGDYPAMNDTVVFQTLEDSLVEP